MSSEAWRLTYHSSFPRTVAVDRIADNDDAGRNAGACPEVFVAFEAAHRVTDYQGTADRALGIVFVSARIAEIDQCPVTQLLRDEPLELAGNCGDSALIGGNQFAQVLGIEA